MNILYIITLADGGGAQKYVLDMATHFQGTIAAGSEHNYLFEQAEQRGFQAYRLKHLKRNIHPVSDILAFFEIYSLVKQIKPDLVHLNSSKAGFLGSIAAKLAGCKVVFTAHGFFYFYNTPLAIKYLYIFLEKFASLFRDFIITVSENDRGKALQYKIISAKRIKTIYYSIKPLEFLPRDRARQKLGIGSNDFIIGNIAQYYHRKGLDILLYAISKLPKKNNTKLVLIGDGPEKNNLKNQAAKLSLQDTVLFIGHLSNAAEYLRAFDIFVLSSRREGFPFVLLESLQANIPIIATNVGGNCELVGPAGMIVPSENIQELTAAISKLINDAAMRSSFAQATKIRSSLFTEESMMQETEKIYSLVAPGLSASIRRNNSSAS